MGITQAKTGVEVERLIGEALAAIENLPKWGPKRLDWKASKDHDPGELGTDPVIVYVDTEDVSPNSVDVLFEADWGTQEDANFIEACNPANIRQLLASLAAERAEAVRMREAAIAVLAYRNGDLPTRGWLRDNDASRKALSELAAALSPSQGEKS